MKNLWIRTVLLVAVLAGTGLAIGCGGSNPEGSYRTSDGTSTVELKGGKASLNFGQIHIDGAYSVEGNKLTIRPLEGDTSQTMVFVINKDGSLQAPEGSPFGRLDKVK